MEPNRGKAFGVAAAFCTSLLWGLSFLSIKVAVAVVPPMTMGFIRFAAASLVLLALKRALAPRDKLTRKELPLMAASGLVGVTLYFFMENNGVKLLSASEASMVIGFIPVMTILAESATTRRRLGWPVVLGALVSVAGVWLIVSKGLLSPVSPGDPGSGVGPTRLMGYVLMGGAGISWVAYSLMSRKLFGRHDRISVVCWQSLAGAIGFIPALPFEARDWQIPTPSIWLHLAYLAIGCSALGYWLYGLSLQKLGPGVSSVFINLIPVVTAVAAWFLLGERLAPAQFAGGAAVVAGVCLATLIPVKTSSHSP